MSVYTRIAELLNRLATLTSITRTETEDATRLTVHGGSPAEFDARHEAVAERLGAILTRMEGR